MREIGEALEQIGLVPVIAREGPVDIVSQAQVLLAGGVQCAEITFRTAAAEESIRPSSPGEHRQAHSPTSRSPGAGTR